MKTMVGDENTENGRKKIDVRQGEKKRDFFPLFPKRKPENDLTPYRSVAIIEARRFRKSRRKRMCLPGAASNTERRACSGGMDMNYLRITNENIDREHICCAMSNKQSVVKKQWLKQRFAEGLVFYRSEERGKCFIEYIPGENAWVPIEAEGYLYINCLWVSGSLKGHGYSNELLEVCIRDARSQGRKGLCILSSGKRKKEFLADPGFLAHKGFVPADTSDCGITLLYLPLDPAEKPPRFRECARHPVVEEKGFVLYYTDQCPFTDYWVSRVEEAAKTHHIPLKVVHITNREDARNVPAPVTTYALFRDGVFLTQAIQSDKKFLALAGVKI